MRMQAPPLPFHPLKLLAAGLLCLLLSACALQPPGPDTTDLATRADQARAEGDPEEALRLYRAASEATDDDVELAILDLRVADLRLDMGEPSMARNLLDRISDSDQPAIVMDLRAVVLARLALEDDQAATALDTVEKRLPGERDARPRLLDVQALALRALDRGLESARVRNDLESLLAWPGDIERNRQLLWDALQETPMSALREIMPPAPDRFGAWIELAYMVRTYRLDPPRLQEQVDLWSERYPEHPALDRIAPEVMTRYREEAQPAHHVAVLLPLSGPLATAGEAVRNGILAAYYHADGTAERPELTIVDVGEDGNDPWSAYLEAVQKGADLVVGPLSRQSVGTLAARGNLPVPVLALNAIPGELEAPPNLYRFGLLPEDEAREAARHAARQGLRHAIVLVPHGEWGNRIRTAFTRAYERNGGVTLEYETYSSDEQDYSAPLRRLLDLDTSRQRERRLRRTIGRNVNFEPRRRQDVEVVFIAAFPQQARLIRPQIRFHQGIGLPILATSHIYTGNPEDVDRDMADLVFFDIPWLLTDNAALGLTRSDLERYWEEDIREHARLYALGLDAYRLMPYLAVLRSNPTETLDGATGVLRIDGTGLISRDLLPARMTGDGIELLNRVPAADRSAINAGQPAYDRENKDVQETTGREARQ